MRLPESIYLIILNICQISLEDAEMDVFVAGEIS